MTHIAVTGILLTLAFTHASLPIMAQQFLADGTAVLTPHPKCAGNAAQVWDDCLKRMDDDSGVIREAIRMSRGTVFFKAGIYKLNQTVNLRPMLTYKGEGGFSPTFGSVLIQTVPNTPFFTVAGEISSVTIVGLTFGGLNARGIAARDRSSLLKNSTIRDNFFYADLSEGIDTPMSGTRIERNAFATNGREGLEPDRRRHIRSHRPANPATEDNWITGNLFRAAKSGDVPGSEPVRESVFFESVAGLHVIGNDFEGGTSDTVLRVQASSRVNIQGNWFEGNNGRSHMMFPAAGNYQIHLKDNFYSMSKCPGNCLLFAIDKTFGGAGTLRVFMGYEAGLAFSARRLDGSVAYQTELTDTSSQPSLTFNGPLCLMKYIGNQASTNHCQ